MRGSLLGASPWYQLIMVFLIAMLSAFLVLALSTLLVPVFFDISRNELMMIFEEDPSSLPIEVLKFLQGFNTLGTFLIPAFVGAYLLSPFPSDFLQVNSFSKRPIWVIVLVIIVTISGTIISDALFRLSYQIPFPDFLRGVEEYLIGGQQNMEKQMIQLLEMNSVMDFVEMFMIIAILPAVCEETLFRGVIQPIFIKGFKNVHIGIVVTSIIFGIMHQQFYSFLSITALSVVLGYLKYWSKSLWVPVIMHLVNNGSILIAVYFFNVSTEDLSSSTEPWNVTEFVLGVAFFVGGLALLYKLLKSNHRAMPPINLPPDQGAEPPK
jgi:hypothetical protein